MVSFKELRDASFADWQAMVDNCSKTIATLNGSADRFTTEVVNKAGAAHWTGAAAERAQAEIKDALARIEEENAVVTELRAVMSDGLAQFSDTQAQLHRLLLEAQDLHFIVDDNGSVVPDLSYAPTLRAFPGMQEKLAQQLQEMQSRITEMVAVATALDHETAVALKKALPENG